jgi:hypothetical protein
MQSTQHSLTECCEKHSNIEHFYTGMQETIPGDITESSVTPETVRNPVGDDTQGRRSSKLPGRPASGDCSFPQVSPN